MADSEKKRYVQDMLLQAVQRRQTDVHRLKVGLNLRQQFHAMLAQGKVPNHERFAWLQQQSKQLVDLLLVMAEDYDKQHPTDMASTLDLLDIIKMATGTLTGAINQGAIQPSVLKVSDAPVTAEEAQQARAAAEADEEDEDDDGESAEDEDGEEDE